MPYLFDGARLLLAIGLLLLAAHAIGRLFEAWRLPRVIGEIVGGLLLGPTFAAYLFPAQIEAFFPRTGWVASLLPICSQIGLVLLMYTSGAHLRTFTEQGERKVVAVLSVIGIVIPFLAGLLVVQFLDITNLVGPNNHGAAFVLVFGTAIAIASIPVISRIMIDLGIMETPFARIVIATAVVDDVVLYVVLAIALSLAQANVGHVDKLATLLHLEPASLWVSVAHVVATIAILLIALFGSSYVLRRAFGWRLPILSWDNSAVVQMLLLTVVAMASIFLGVNPMFGALAAGMAAGRAATHAGVGSANSLRYLSQFVFVPLYFALVGFKLDLIHHFDAAFFVGFLAFACAVKAASIYAGARIAGESNATAINLAAALNARGGPGIVLATVAFEAKIINENFFAILVLTAIATSLFAGAWLGRTVRNGGELRSQNSLVKRSMNALRARA